MAHRLKILFTIPKSPVLVVVVTRRLGDSLMMLSIRQAMSMATRFSTHLGNNAISSITSLDQGSGRFHNGVNAGPAMVLGASMDRQSHGSRFPDIQTRC